MKKMTLDQMKLELAADKDVRRAIEVMQKYYDELQEAGETSNSEISLATGMDPSSVSRLLNGRTGNPTLLTIAKVFRAMNMRISPKIEKLNGLEAEKSNSRHIHSYDSELQNYEIMNLVIPDTKSRTSAYRQAAQDIRPRQPSITYNNSRAKVTGGIHG